MCFLHVEIQGAFPAKDDVGPDLVQGWSSMVHAKDSESNFNTLSRSLKFDSLLYQMATSSPPPPHPTPKQNRISDGGEPI